MKYLRRLGGLHLHELEYAFGVVQEVPHPRHDAHPNPDGTIPSLPVWAFHREVKKSQFGKARANAIRLQHTIPMYTEVHEG